MFWAFAARDETPARQAHPNDPITSAPITRSGRAYESGSQDAIWLTQLRADDERALEAIMRAYFDDVAEIALYYLRVSDRARDVAQETFIKCWEQRHRLRDDTVLLSFLRRVARNRALDLLRSDTRTRKLAEQITREQTSTPPVMNAGVHALEAAEFSAMVRRAAATLTPRVREVFLLYYEQSLTPSEIAAVLEVAPATVYRQLQKAINVMTDTLSDWSR